MFDYASVVKNERQNKEGAKPRRIQRLLVADSGFEPL